MQRRWISAWLNNQGPYPRPRRALLWLLAHPCCNLPRHVRSVTVTSCSPCGSASLCSVPTTPVMAEPPAELGSFTGGFGEAEHTWEALSMALVV